MIESHVDAQIAARIARVKHEQAARRQQRAELAEARQAGLKARHTAKLKRRCAVCNRLLKAGRGRACVRGCGVYLCRAPHQPPCSDVHGGQCPNRPTPTEDAA